MRNTYIITSKFFEQLKQRAKKLKKENNIPHHEALDSIAKSMGENANDPKLTIWKQLCEHHKITQRTEDALKNGFVIAIDIKDGIDYSGDLFIEDGTAHALCRDAVYPFYLKEWMKKVFQK